MKFLHRRRTGDETKRQMITPDHDRLVGVPWRQRELRRRGRQRSLDDVAPDPHDLAVDDRSGIGEQLAGLGAPQLDAELFEHSQRSIVNRLDTLGRQHRQGAVRVLDLSPFELPNNRLARS